MELSYDCKYKNNGIVILYGAGEFDSHPQGKDFENLVKELAERNPKAVGYDFSELTFINTSALAAVVRSHKYLMQKDPPIDDFLVESSNPFVKNIFTKTGLDKIIRFRSVDSVLEELALQN